jgi:hypothetical protein
MAEIDIERKRRGGWSWALALIILLVVVGMAWYLAGAPDDRTDIPDMDRGEETQEVPPGTPPTVTP